MMIKRIYKIGALLLGLGFAATPAVGGVYPPPCTVTGFKVNSFSVNQQLILEIYNNVEQQSGQVQRYPAGMPLNVLGMSVTNFGPVSRPMRFVMKINEGNQLWASIGPISTVQSIPAGATVSLDASSFEVTNADLTTFQSSSSLSQGAVNELGGFSDFNDASSLLSKKFKICIVPLTDAQQGNSPETNAACFACTYLSLLAPAAGGTCNVPMIVWPHNNYIPSLLPTFVWTPAYSTECPRNRITYRLEVMEENSQSAPMVRVNIAAGVTTYNWSPSDRALKPGVKYFWRIVALCKDKPFCGPSGRGWNIVKWFKFKNTKQACSYTSKQVLDYIDHYAPADIKSALEGLAGKAIVSPQGNNQQFICDLLSGRIAAKGWKLKKK